jgi:tRNA(Arg) A34 adenosine deaminase TadA
MNLSTRITRGDFLKLAGLSAASVSALWMKTGTLAAGPPSETAEFCDEYDPATTQMLATEMGKPYSGVPKPLPPHDSFTYIQPWDKYDPTCTLEEQAQCANVPSQTANIKVAGVYDGIEVSDNEWIKMACDEARRSVEAGGGPFGAVIVQIDDQTGNVLRYWRNHNHVPQWHDPTAHAEVSTIRAACKQLGVFNLGQISKTQTQLPQTGATSHCEIYINGEPCAMCYGAISWARIPVVVFGATRFDASVQGVNFSDEGIYVELSKPYRERQRIKVYQSSTPNSLDAFNLWKRSKKTQY